LRNIESQKAKKFSDILLSHGIDLREWDDEEEDESMESDEEEETD
jgi:hypothetical protein